MGKDMDKEEEQQWIDIAGEGGLDFVKFLDKLEEDGFTIGEDEERAEQGNIDLLFNDEERESFIERRLQDLGQIQATHPELILSLFRAFLQNHDLRLLALVWGLFQLKHRIKFNKETKDAGDEAL